MHRNNKPGRIVKGTVKQTTLKDASGIWTLDEAMQAHRANAWPQPDLLQPVAKSLKFKWVSGGGTGLYRYGMRGGDQRKFTLSTWFKKGLKTGVDDLGFLSANWGTSYASLHIATNQSNEGIQIYDWGSGLGGVFSISTIPVFRDPSAWYHLVIAVDTTQTIAFNRIKIWVNGVQITDFTNNNGWNTANGGFPSLGYETPVNRPGGLMTVGVSANNDSIMSSKTFDGQLAEYNFIDGAALSPSFFGTTTSTGRWIPKPYAGSYGTNGFYLPFDNNITSQTLGYDASVNGTSIYDADQDPYRGSVALHLTGNGPAGGNNNVFADSSPNNIAVVRSGSATQGSFSPFLIQDHTAYNPSVHGASAYFGTSDTDNVYATSNTALNILTNNFTVEFWANWTAWAGEQRFILMGQSGSSALEIGRGTGSNILQVYTNTSLKMSYTWSPTIGSWNHIAVVRTGTGAGQLALYINGVLQATGTSADSIGNNNFFVGGLNWAAGYNMRGYISNVRVINGAAVYTSNFTPAMRPFGTLTNNLLTFSEEFSNSYWTAQSAVVGLTTNAAIAPDGTPSATLLVPSTSSAGQNIAGLHDSAAGVNTFSIYAKSAGYRYMQCFHSRSAGGDSGYVTFDLTTGTVTNSSVWSGSIVDVGNGWYRIIATTSSLAGASANSNVRWAITDGTASRAPVFTGNGTSGIYVWGAQAELASSVGNYTPTPANFSTAPALLLNFANAAVVDSAGAGNVVTVSNATITSSAKYGSGALTFNGSGDTFQSSWSLNNQLSPYVADWTLETWVYMTKSLSSVQVVANYGYESGSTRSFVWYYNGDGTFRLAQSPDGSTNYDAGFGAPRGGFALNTWYHLAIVRNSGAMTMYVNGRAMPNTLSAYNISSISTGVFRLGTDGTNHFGGSMDDVRLTKGVARYTTDFTPPARALPETGGDSFATKGINAGVVRSFTTAGTTSWTAPTDVTQVEVLVVAGGGSGGNFHGGGGGAGGLIYNNSYPVTPGQTYTVAVGDGGAAVTVTRGINGGNSQFGNLIAIGGGGGGNEQTSQTGVVGGSGGGGSYNGSGGAGTAGQGFAGGTAVSITAAYAAAGGGGAGGVGGNPPNFSQGGAGGAGLQFGIRGTPAFYAAGGGGSVYNAAGIGIGGSGIGGSGGSFSSSIAATSGATNTGSGGGGGERASGANNSGAGGSGIVVVRYTTASEYGFTEDSLVDSPTSYGHDMQLGGEVIGNYCTWNNVAPVVAGFSDTRLFTNGNLTFTATGSTGSEVFGTISVTTGKWYWELIIDNAVSSAGPLVGLWLNDQYRISYRGNGTATNNLGAIALSGFPTYTNNDVISIAVDVDAGYIWYAKNGAWIQGNPLTGASPVTSWTANTKITPAMNWDNVNGPKKITANFGQTPFIYAAPAGFNTLNTKSLPRLTSAVAINPNQYFDAITWTAVASETTRTVTGLNFQPDLVWIKARNTSQNHYLVDSVRGSGSLLRSNTTASESTGFTWLTPTSNGFTYTNDLLATTDGYVAWCWRAGSTAVSNTAGSITSSVSANTASGFSVVTWSGNNTNGATIGHGLTTAPSMFIIKSRNTVANWYVWHTGLTGATYGLTLNATDAEAIFTFGTATVGASTITAVQGANGLANVNASATNYVGYFWTEVAGFSKFGTYTANGSSDGPFIHCGFKPRFILIKAKSSTSQWVMIDTARNTQNTAVGSSSIFANSTSAEENGNTSELFDIVSNGFKLRSNGRVNVSTVTHIFMAFAENPFKDANAAAPAIPARTPVATVFGYTGADQSYVVPAGVSRIRVAAWGAGGSAGTPTTGGTLSGNGGGAGSVEGFLDVVPGETLTIKVGQGVDALSGTVGNGTNTGAVLGSSIYGGGGQNGTGDGAGSNAGTAGAGGGASSIVRASTVTTLLVAAGGGGAAGAGYTGANPSANGGVGGAGAGTGGTGRGNLGTFTSGAGTYAGYPGTGGGGGGGGGGSGSTANLGNGDPGVGGSNTVPNSCTGYSGSTRTPGNTGSAYWDGASGFGGIAPVAGGSITTSDGRIVIIG